MEIQKKALDLIFSAFLYLALFQNLSTSSNTRNVTVTPIIIPTAVPNINAIIVSFSL